MPTINWDTAVVEPAHHGAGAQLSVDVVGADAAWAARFNEMAAAHYERGEVRGGGWGAVRYHEVEGIVTVDDLHGDDLAPIQNYLDEQAKSAEARRP